MRLSGICLTIVFSVIVFGTHASAYVLCSTEPTGMVAWWAGEGNTRDKVGPHNGGFYPQVGFAAGKVGQSFDFNGVNNHISIRNTSSLQLGNALTLAAWIKTSSIKNDQSILEKGKDFSGSYGLSLNGSPGYLGTARLHIYELSPSAVDTVNPVNDGNWHFLVGTWDGAQLKIYVDGILENSVSATGSLTINTEDLALGSRIDTSLYYYQGLLDEIQIYGRALTAAEIAVLFEGSATVSCPATIGTFRHGDDWYLDLTRSWTWDAGDETRLFNGGVDGVMPAVGDWNADGTTDLGVFYGNGMWRLDTDGNRRWNAAVDAQFKFGIVGDIPVTGDWNGDGVTDVGVFRGSGQWYLDTNGNHDWDAGDVTFKFGLAGDIPVTGDWNGDGIADIGVFRGNGRWFLDTNGNHSWNAGIDATFKFGMTGETPVTGDWNDDGVTDVGVFWAYKGDWYLDMNGNYDWDAGDDIFRFGIDGDVPVTGYW